MSGEDFQDGLRTEVHDEANQSSLAALDAEEASLAVKVALDVLDDARDALSRACDIPTRSLAALFEASQVRIDAGRAVWRAKDAYQAALLDAAEATS